MAFLRTHNGEYQEIAYPGALFTDARGVNDQGDVVGWYFNENETDRPNQMDFYAFLYKNGQYQRLYGPRPNDIIFPSAINRKGDIVGGVYYGMTPEWRYTPRGFLLKDGQLTWLDTNPSGIGASNPWARSINNMGQIVVTDFGDSYLWQEGTFHKLPPIPGDYQYVDIHAEGLNDQGDIVGWYVGYKAGQSDYRGFVATTSPAPLW
jgi:uncharacterized membrane protein